MSENIDLGKFAKSFVQPLSYFKAVAILIKIGMVAAVVAGLGYAVWKAYIKKPEPTQTIKEITVEEGGQVILQKNEEEKVFSIFTEPFFQLTDEMEPGVRFGMRWEF